MVEVNSYGAPAPPGRLAKKRPGPQGAGWV